MNAIAKITKRVESDYKILEQDIENVWGIDKARIDEISSRIQKLESIIDKAINEINYSNIKEEERKDQTVWLRWYKSGIPELKDKLEKKDFFKWFFQLSSPKPSK